MKICETQMTQTLDGQETIRHGESPFAEGFIYFSWCSFVSISRHIQAEDLGDIIL